MMVIAYKNTTAIVFVKIRFFLHLEKMSCKTHEKGYFRRAKESFCTEYCFQSFEEISNELIVSQRSFSSDHRPVQAESNSQNSEKTKTNE